MKQKPRQNRLIMEGDLLWAAIRKASIRPEESILCLIQPGTVKFIVLSGFRLVISWETQLRLPVLGRLAFLIPPVIAQLLSSEAVHSQVGVEIAIQGEDVVARLTDHLGSYEIRWKSDLASFRAPVEFSELIKVPEALLEVSYLKISDAAHQAVAKLARMESDGQIHREKLAVLVDLDFGRLSINGREIVATAGSRYYFDPRLVIRALEFIKEPMVRVGITPLGDGQRACLSLLAKQADWTVFCSLLSIGKDTQKLYPLPSRRSG